MGVSGHVLEDRWVVFGVFQDTSCSARHSFLFMLRSRPGGAETDPLEDERASVEDQEHSLGNIPADFVAHRSGPVGRSVLVQLAQVGRGHVAGKTGVVHFLLGSNMINSLGERNRTPGQRKDGCSSSMSIFLERRSARVFFFGPVGRQSILMIGKLWSIVT